MIIKLNWNTEPWGYSAMFKEIKVTMRRIMGTGHVCGYVGTVGGVDVPFRDCIGKMEGAIDDLLVS